MKYETSQKWLTVAIFQKWQDSSVPLWTEIAVILNWRYRLEIWYGLVWFDKVWYGFVWFGMVLLVWGGGQMTIIDWNQMTVMDEFQR